MFFKKFYYTFEFEIYCSFLQLYNFRLTLLDRREIPTQELLRQGIHPHRVENPSGGYDTVAVVWKSADGEAPKFDGLWLHGQHGKIEVKYAQDSILDPIIFPILFPKGTLGYQRGMLYNNFVAGQQGYILFYVFFMKWVLFFWIILVIFIRLVVFILYFI